MKGNFQGICEERTFDDLMVLEGTIPKDLSGAFLRTGPDPQFDPVGGYHWFDGDGMVHGVFITEGKASYMNNWIRTPRWEFEHGLGHAAVLKLGDMEGLSGLFKILVLTPLKKFLGLAPLEKLKQGTANTNLLFWKDRILALVESDLPFKIKVGPKGVESLGHDDFGGQIDFSIIAHPHVDRKTGELIAIGYDIEKEDRDGSYAVIGPDGQVRTKFPLKFRNKIMIHDVAITEHYTIVQEGSLTFNPKRIVEGSVFVMDYNQTVRFHVLPRYAKSQGEAIQIDLPNPGMSFHVMNAYEVDADNIYLWACLARKFSMDFGKAEDESLPNVLYRWTLNHKTKQVTETVVYDANNIEFVRTNDDMFGYKTKFGYGALLEMGGTKNKVSNDQGPKTFGEVKIDLDSGKVVGQIDFGEKRRAGEIVFAPRVGAKTEDDGYLMGFLYDEAIGTSELAIFDAKTMAKTPVARILIPQRVPFGFHALWVHDSQLKAQK